MAGVERVELNPAGLREYLRGPDLLPTLERLAVGVEGRAQALASDHVETGEYEHSIHREPYRNRGRRTVRVIADDDKAAELEQELHVMGRAAG